MYHLSKICNWIAQQILGTLTSWNILLKGVIPSCLTHPRMQRIAKNQWRSNIITFLHSSQTQNSIARQELDSQRSKKILILPKYLEMTQRILFFQSCTKMTQKSFVLPKLPQRFLRQLRQFDYIQSHPEQPRDSKFLYQSWNSPSCSGSKQGPMVLFLMNNQKHCQYML